MKQTEYIIVGLGIAGISVCRTLDELGKDYVVFDTGSGSATEVAGGVVNPVVIKRLNPVWRASEFLEHATAFYKSLQGFLKHPFYKPTELLRIFSSAEEQNNWTVAGDSEKLKKLVNPIPLRNNYPTVNAPFGFGHVNGCLQLDTSSLIRSFRQYLQTAGKLVESTFDVSKSNRFPDGVAWDGYQAKRIILTQGVKALDDTPYRTDYIIPKKGEYLLFRSRDLKLDRIIKGPFFVIPKGGDLYQTGATFAHGDNSPETTVKGREKMSEALRKMINVPFEIMDQTTGFRPTVKDRRPLLGQLDDKHPVYLLNGLGSRGLLMGPLLAEWLIDHIENGSDLPSEVDIRRYR